MSSTSTQPGTRHSKRVQRRLAMVERHLDRLDGFGKRQPRPAPRRQGTRQGVVAAARREG